MLEINFRLFGLERIVAFVKVTKHLSANTERLCGTLTKR